MTKDHPQEHVVEENTQQPFQVVLIDIKKAAHDKEIHCFKKPLLESDDLNYVAISYRWGELQETIVDTKAGYLATITSFDLEDFFQLCVTMSKEPDLKSMDYVWVDAICVNQANNEQRKETIYHMTSIYERATYILAVPDLHAAHLKKTMTSNDVIMSHLCHHQTNIYHLIHGNIDQLHELDQTFLDTIGVPQDPSLRELMKNYTDCFTNAWIRLQERHRDFDPVIILDHLYDLHRVVSIPTSPSSSSSSGDKSDDSDSLSCNSDDPRLLSYNELTYVYRTGMIEDNIQSLHSCHEINCPLKCVGVISKYRYKRQPHGHKWSQEIVKRSTEICQSMHFLTDLIMDWSSRVWVISEFHISKKKNNLKYWFTQLTPPEEQETAVTFFKFDIHDPRLNVIRNTSDMFFYINSVTSDAVYLRFHKTFIKQLNEQTFLEMMLKSKASKNEDRFYSIFAMFPEYKNLLKKSNNDDVVKHWHITSILSVKLKLYQVMTNQDKLDLLYLSVYGDIASPTLPTFATSNIEWGGFFGFKHPTYYGEDDLTSKIKVSLHHQKEGDGLCYLVLKPVKYFTASEHPMNPWRVHIIKANHNIFQTLCKRLDLDDSMETTDWVVVPNIKPANPNIYNKYMASYIILIGSFEKNTWILANKPAVFSNCFYVWTEYTPAESFDGFHIY